MGVAVILLKVVFAAAVGSFGLMIGAVIWAKTFGHGGHGLDAVVYMFEGGAVGLVIGVAAAVGGMVWLKFTQQALVWGTVLSMTGAVLVFGLIQVLDAFERW